MLHLQAGIMDGDDDAPVMEDKETEILAALGYPNPYLETRLNVWTVMVNRVLLNV